MKGLRIKGRGEGDDRIAIERHHAEFAALVNASCGGVNISTATLGGCAALRDGAVTPGVYLIVDAWGLRSRLESWAPLLPRALALSRFDETPRVCEIVSDWSVRAMCVCLSSVFMCV